MQTHAGWVQATRWHIDKGYPMARTWDEAKELWTAQKEIEDLGEEEEKKSLGIVA